MKALLKVRPAAACTIKRGDGFSSPVSFATAYSALGIDVLKALINAFPAGSTTEETGWLPLHVACVMVGGNLDARLEVVKCLLQHHSAAAAATTKEGLTPLHIRYGKGALKQPPSQHCVAGRNSQMSTSYSTHHMNWPYS